MAISSFGIPYSTSFSEVAASVTAKATTDENECGETLVDKTLVIVDLTQHNGREAGSTKRNGEKARRIPCNF